MKRLCISFTILLFTLSCKERGLGSTALANEVEGNCVEVVSENALQRKKRVDRVGDNHEINEVTFLARAEVADQLDDEPSKFVEAYFVSVTSDAGSHVWLMGLDVTAGTCQIKTAEVVTTI